ncbi:hypothetical protein EKH79_02810 [Dyella dinghuensis]|uniref:Uncharacterized protein n=1 Tax=Dyella dinghuensis TaxID=1920169 RepID=A0A3S0S5Y1_9GAMM|nr:hypothetical protein [Dyella dinghuensis]RUL66760.1 hypothetical protein EKH79_02810 [Dyella dinghuensis]
MDDSYDTEVSTVLLGFGLLDRAQRLAFSEQFNNFMYGSPQRQRSLMEYWSSQCRESENPTARMIAESAADYVVSKKKRRKGKRSK